MNNFVKKNLLGVGVSVASRIEVLEYLVKNSLKGSKKIFIVTPNPELLVMAKKDENYKKVLNSADLALPDGVGIMLAGKFLGLSLKDRITGVDLVENLCKRISNQPITVSFVGGRPGIAERTVECLKKRYFGLKTTFFGEEIEDFSKLKGTDILFVAFGSPKQEFWIADNLKRLPVKVVIGVGGSFDFISGETPRAPKIIRQIGFEWLFRLIIEPWRAKRQMALVEFIFLVLKEKFAII